MANSTASKSVWLMLLCAVILVLGSVMIPKKQAVVLVPQAQSENHEITTPTLVTPAPLPVQSPPAVTFDPEILAKANELNHPESNAERDLEIIDEFIQLYAKAHRSGNPSGDNADITAALTGSANQAEAKLLPSSERTVSNGELVDRWGSPYWFHPNSGHETEIRSAGPDRVLFTADDVIRNPSPPGSGATPTE